MQHSPAIDALSAALGAEPSLQDSPRLAVWEFDPAADGVGLLRSARPSVHSLTGQLNTILTMVEKRRLRLRWVVAYVGPDSSRAAAEWLAARPENEAPTWAAWASLDRLARTPDKRLASSSDCARVRSFCTFRTSPSASTTSRVWSSSSSCCPSRTLNIATSFADWETVAVRRKVGYGPTGER